jgi:uncharacterized alpha-E superfamily protein
VLSRTADNLYWMARYVERAENVARLLDVGLRMSLTPLDEEVRSNEWRSSLLATGSAEGFYEKHEVATSDAVIHYLTCEPSNPSSIMGCLETARRNARAVRTAVTADVWEAVNDTWLEARRLAPQDFSVDRVRPFLDWVKSRSQLVGGAISHTMLRTDAFWFTRLGGFIERADNTARILDVKYHVLLPEYEEVGGGLDHFQWTAILRAVSARRAYHYLYHERVQPWRLAELLILRPEMPRSLLSCMNRTTAYLDALAEAYGARGEAQRRAGRMHSRLRFAKVDEVFQSGLHEFITEFIDTNAALGDEIARQYLS